MTAASTRPNVPGRPPARTALVVLLAAPLIAALALWAAGWSGARAAPRDLPVGVAGPPAAAAPAVAAFEARPGAFEVHRFPDEAAAREAVREREVYGAVVAGPGGPKLLTASAAGPVVAQLLRAAVEAPGGPGGTGVPVTDVVPAPPADPRGAALNGSVLPLAVAGIASGALVTVLRLRGRGAVAALLGAAALVGAVGASIAGSWLGVITGNWWAQAAALGATTLAVGAAAAGLAALVGPAGIGLVALPVMLIGNPFSGVSSAPEMLPEPAGLIGQWMPPGAGASLLRSVAFFDGGGAGPATTLGVWILLGLAAVWAGGRRAGRTAGTAPEAVREPALAVPAA